MRATEYAGAGPTADVAVLRERALRDLASGRFDHWIDPAAPLPAVRISALVDTGDHRRARRELETVTAAELGAWSPRELVLVATAASRVGPIETCMDLLELVASREGSVLSGGDDEVVPAAFVEALCLTGLGRYDDAQDRYQEALHVAEGIGPVVDAQVRAELGRLHLGLGPAGARAARAHLVAAAVCLRASGMTAQADRTTELLEGNGPVGCAGPDRGVLEPGARWLVGFGLRIPTSVEDDPGLHALRHVIMNAGRGVPGDELASLSDGDPQGIVSPTIDRLAEHDEGLADHLTRSIVVGDEVCYEPARAVRWSLDPPDAGAVRTAAS